MVKSLSSSLKETADWSLKIVG